MSYVYKLCEARHNERTLVIFTITDNTTGGSTLELVQIPKSLLKDTLTILGQEYVYCPGWLLKKIEESFRHQGKTLRTLTTQQAREMVDLEDYLRTAAPALLCQNTLADYKPEEAAHGT